MSHSWGCPLASTDTCTTYTHPYVDMRAHTPPPTHPTNAGQVTAFRSQLGHQSIALSTVFDGKAYAWDVSTLKKRKGTGVPLHCSINEFGWSGKHLYGQRKIGLPRSHLAGCPFRH